MSFIDEEVAQPCVEAIFDRPWLSGLDQMLQDAGVQRLLRRQKEDRHSSAAEAVYDRLSLGRRRVTGQRTTPLQTAQA